ncbi:MAG: hypothetical protein MUC36_16805 [Planctomycetes bacterium]|jgi:hypothetical protein|nr:hypothetical protein [Planctomycetota bacterium]
MRSFVLLSTVALAACATSTPSEAWHDLQRERLQRLHEPREAADSVAAVIAATPGSGEQEPRKIDQREPGRAGQGPRRYRTSLQPLSVRATVGVGNVAARVRGTRLDDRADARFVGVAVDAGNGAAVQADLWSSDQELFAGRRINDGVAPADADAGLSGIDVFPHVRLDPFEGAFTMPVRLGAFADWQVLDHDTAGVEREWLSIGPRIVLEPCLRLLGDDDDSLSLFVRLGGDVGAAWFEERFRNGDDRDHTLRLGGELGGGLRGKFGSLQLEAGYRVQHARLDGTDTSLLGDRDGTELQRQQVFLGFGWIY